MSKIIKIFKNAMPRAASWVILLKLILYVFLSFPNISTMFGNHARFHSSEINFKFSVSSLRCFIQNCIYCKCPAISQTVLQLVLNSLSGKFSILCLANSVFLDANFQMQQIILQKMLSLVAHSSPFSCRWVLYLVLIKDAFFS